MRLRGSERPLRRRRGAPLWVQRFIGLILAPVWLAIAAFWFSVTPTWALAMPEYWTAVVLWGAFGWWWFGDEPIPQRRAQSRRKTQGRWLTVAAALGFIWSLQFVDRSLIWAALAFVGFFLAAMAKGAWVFGVTSKTAYCSRCGANTLFLSMKGQLCCRKCGAPLTPVPAAATSVPIAVSGRDPTYSSDEPTTRAFRPTSSGLPGYRKSPAGARRCLAAASVLVLVSWVAVGALALLPPSSPGVVAALVSLPTSLALTLVLLLSARRIQRKVQPKKPLE